MTHNIRRAVHPAGRPRGQGTSSSPRSCRAGRRKDAQPSSRRPGRIETRLHRRFRGRCRLGMRRVGRWRRLRPGNPREVRRRGRQRLRPTGDRDRIGYGIVWHDGSLLHPGGTGHPRPGSVNSSHRPGAQSSAAGSSRFLASFLVRSIVLPTCLGPVLGLFIPHAAISETSSNCWKFSVISVSSSLACVVERPSRTFWMAA